MKRPWSDPRSDLLADVLDDGDRYRALSESPSPPLLTDDEHRCIAMTGDLYNLLSRIVGKGAPRTEDLDEFAVHIHGIQNMVLAQAAARQWPYQYRLLGELIPNPNPHADPPPAPSLEGA